MLAQRRTHVGSWPHSSASAHRLQPPFNSPQVDSLSRSLRVLPPPVDEPHQLSHWGALAHFFPFFLFFFLPLPRHAAHVRRSSHSLPLKAPRKPSGLVSAASCTRLRFQAAITAASRWLLIGFSLLSLLLLLLLLFCKREGMQGEAEPQRRVLSVALPAAATSFFFS